MAVAGRPACGRVAGCGRMAGGCLHVVGWPAGRMAWPPDGRVAVCVAGWPGLAQIVPGQG